MKAVFWMRRGSKAPESHRQEFMCWNTSDSSQTDCFVQVFMKKLSPPNGTDFKCLRSENVFAVSKKKSDANSRTAFRSRLIALVVPWCYFLFGKKQDVLKLSRGGRVRIIMSIESVKGLESFEGNL